MWIKLGIAGAVLYFLVPKNTGTLGGVGVGRAGLFGSLASFLGLNGQMCPTGQKWVTHTDGVNYCATDCANTPGCSVSYVGSSGDGGDSADGFSGDGGDNSGGATSDSGDTNGLITSPSQVDPSLGTA